MGKINSTLNTVTVMPELAAKFRALGASAARNAPDEASARYLSDIARLKGLVVQARTPTDN